MSVNSSQEWEMIQNEFEGTSVSSFGIEVVETSSSKPPPIIIPSLHVCIGCTEPSPDGALCENCQDAFSSGNSITTTSAQSSKDDEKVKAVSALDNTNMLDISDLSADYTDDDSTHEESEKDKPNDCNKVPGDFSCKCADLRCSSKIQGTNVNSSPWTCSNIARGCNSKFSVECTKERCSQSQVCVNCEFITCACNSEATAPCKTSAKHVGECYRCMNYDKGCCGLFAPDCCYMRTSDVQQPRECFECVYNGMDNHLKRMKHEIDIDVDNADKAYSGSFYRIEVYSADTASWQPGIAHELRGDIGYQVILDDDKSSIKLLASEGNFLDLLTLQEITFRLRPRNVSMAQSAANKRLRRKCRFAPPCGGVWIEAKEGFDNIDGEWKLAVLTQEAPGAIAVIKYDDPTFADIHLPSRERDPDNCFEASLETGWFRLVTFDDAEGLDADAEGLDADAEEGLNADAEEGLNAEVRYEVSSSQVPGGAPTDDNCAVEDHLLFAAGSINRMASCKPKETGIRIRMKSSTTAGRKASTESQLCWAMEQKDKSFIIIYDAKRIKACKVKTVDILRLWLSDGKFSLIPAPPVLKHGASVVATLLYDCVKQYNDRFVDIDLPQGKTRFDVHVSDIVSQVGSVILFDTPHYPEKAPGFSMQYSQDKLVLYHFEVHSGRLSKNNSDFRGYVCPSVMEYVGDHSEKSPQFAGQDVIALAFWETRCVSKRHDLIIYDPVQAKVHRICMDDNGDMKGCNGFLRSRVCNLNRPIEDFSAIMTAYSLFIGLAQWEYQPLRSIAKNSKNPVAEIARENAIAAEVARRALTAAAKRANATTTCTESESVDASIISKRRNNGSSPITRTAGAADKTKSRAKRARQIDSDSDQSVPPVSSIAAKTSRSGAANTRKRANQVGLIAASSSNPPIAAATASSSNSTAAASSSSNSTAATTRSSKSTAATTRPSNSAAARGSDSALSSASSCSGSSTTSSLRSAFVPVDRSTVTANAAQPDILKIVTDLTDRQASQLAALEVRSNNLEVMSKKALDLVLQKVTDMLSSTSEVRPSAAQANNGVEESQQRAFDQTNAQEHNNGDSDERFTVEEVRELIRCQEAARLEAERIAMAHARSQEPVNRVQRLGALLSESPNGPALGGRANLQGFPGDRLGNINGFYQQEAYGVDHMFPPFTPLVQRYGGRGTPCGDNIHAYMAALNANTQAHANFSLCAAQSNQQNNNLQSYHSTLNANLAIMQAYRPQYF